jgi:hypothetical protein
MEGHGGGKAQGVADPPPKKKTKKQSPIGLKFAQSGHPVDNKQAFADICNFPARQGGANLTIHSFTTTTLALQNVTSLCK